jgi:hypothetical protein
VPRTYRSRRGSFGLQPRVAPNITGQIIALAREYEAKRDQNIMSAWQSGVTFECKKVTDEMVLKYWQEKQKGLDKSDPNYNANANQIMQLQYGIEQSKQDLLHLQGKISDTQYAQFYIKWANKVPRNSEFYRVLQKDAAQLMAQARAKAKANSEQAKTDEFNSFVDRTTRKDIAIGNYLTAAVKDLAGRMNVSVMGNGEMLLATLTQDVKDHPELYRGLLDSIKKADPEFDGNITTGYFTTSVTKAEQGYGKIADRAQKGGYVSAYASAVGAQASMGAWAQNTKAWPVAQSYSAADEAFDAVWNNPKASQMEKSAAAERAAKTYEDLSNTPGIDAGVAAQLKADAARLRGQDGGDAPSYGQAQLNRSGVTPVEAEQLSVWAKAREDMAKNPQKWAYAPVDQNGNFDPTGAGPVGIVPRGSVPNDAVAVMIPTGLGGSVLSYVSPTPVYSKRSDGEEVVSSYHIGYNVGSKTVELWGYVDGDGVTQWSSQSPLADGATAKVDGNGGIHVEPYNPAPLTDQQKIDIVKAYAEQYRQNNDTVNADGMDALVSAMEAQMAASAPVDGASVQTNTFTKGTREDTSEYKFDGKNVVITATHNTIDPKTGEITAEQKTPYTYPVTATQSPTYDPATIAAGSIEGVTNSSPLAASVDAIKYTQSADQVRSQIANPEFQQQFIAQTMNSLHTDNPYDARIAEAWRAATTADASATYNSQFTDLVGKGIPSAVARQHLRGDLTYPGSQPSTGANDATINIRYGAQTLSIPGMPSYMGNKSLTPNEMKQALDTGSIFNGFVTPTGPAAGPAPNQWPTSITSTVTPTTATTSTVTNPTAATAAPTGPAAGPAAATPLPKPPKPDDRMGGR